MIERHHHSTIFAFPQGQLAVAEQTLVSLQATAEAHAEVLQQKQAQDKETEGMASEEQLDAELAAAMAQLRQLEQDVAAAEAAEASAEHLHAALSATLKATLAEEQALKGKKRCGGVKSNALSWP